MPFDFNFTAEVLNSCINNTESATWFSSINSILPIYSITSKLRFAAWIAQCGHESTDFKTLQENLNYRADALLSVFPTHFSGATDANAYAHQPEKIANRVYANRMGNGDETSGDGWKFHGRGLIQITGKENYSKCSQAMYSDDRLLTNPDLLIETDGAVRSACWFWNENNLNVLADSSQTESITRRINGGTNGLSDRTDRYEHAISVLKNVGSAVINDIPEPISITTPPTPSSSPIVLPISPEPDVTSESGISSTIGSLLNGVKSWWNGKS